jgi:hypothetical protein
MNPDPRGYYALLEVPEDATGAEITLAFRRLARVLHPDVPTTGDPDRFIALRAAYDVLSDPSRRSRYDREARIGSNAVVDADELGIPLAPSFEKATARPPRLSDVPLAVWIGVGLIVTVGVHQVLTRVTAEPPGRPTTLATVTPVRPNQPPHPAPDVVRRQPPKLAGIPNHYSIPAPGIITIWRLESDTNRLIPIGQLQPFTPVQALRLFRQPGLMEIRVSEAANGFVVAARLAQGNENAARRAFCAYHAGPAPASGEVLHRSGSGSASLPLHNRGSGPAVVKLRHPGGGVVAAIFIGPSEQTVVSGLPDGVFGVDYAFGEVWSRACDSFTVAVEAWRLPSHYTLAALAPLVIPSDTRAAGLPTALPEQLFNQD